MKIRIWHVNKAMVSAIEKLNDPFKVNAESLDMLRLIETTFGREVLTGGYVKLKKLIELCEKETSVTKESVADAVLWTLQYLFCAMKLTSLKPEKVSEEMLVHGEKKGVNWPRDTCSGRKRNCHEPHSWLGRGFAPERGVFEPQEEIARDNWRLRELHVAL